MRNAISPTRPLNSWHATNIFLLLFVLAVPSAFCQNQRIDSLVSLLTCEPNDQEIEILYELAYCYSNRDYKMGLKYGNDALEISKKIGDSLRIVKAGRIKSYFYRRLNEVDSSLSLSSEILPIARRNKFDDELKSILNGLAYASIHKAYYDKALKYLFESLEMRKIDGDKFEISVALHNIGLVYYKLGDPR